jgi:phage host-nuclease inhibitor protein Gam
MTNRIKLPTTIITRSRAEELLGEIAMLTIEQREQKNALDREMTAARERFETPLTTLGKQIEEKTALLESWASANPSEFPKGRKSIELLHGILGYRTGTPKLKTLPKWTWDRVLENLKSLGKVVAGFVRTKDEVNKEAIIAAVSEGRLEATEARQLGVQVIQEETFFVEPKLEENDARVTLESAMRMAVA